MASNRAHPKSRSRKTTGNVFAHSVRALSVFLSAIAPRRFPIFVVPVPRPSTFSRSCSGLRSLPFVLQTARANLPRSYPKRLTAPLNPKLFSPKHGRCCSRVPVSVKIAFHPSPRLLARFLSVGRPFVPVVPCTRLHNPCSCIFVGRVVLANEFLNTFHMYFIYSIIKCEYLHICYEILFPI